MTPRYTQARSPGTTMPVPRVPYRGVTPVYRGKDETGMALALVKHAGYDPGLTDVSDDQVTCMAEGHDWPRLRVNRSVPKGIRAYLNTDGTYQLVYVCQVCGTERTRTTLPRGQYDANQAYSYVYPRSWVHFTAGDGMSRGRLKTELFTRAVDLLTAATRKGDQ